MTIGVPRINVAQFVPERYAPYRALVQDGLTFFLERLPVHRRRALATHSSHAGGAIGRLLAVMRSCPTLHKLGQVVARDRRLAPALLSALQQLESMPTTMLAGDVRRMLAAELGDVSRDGVELSSEPAVEASVAIVAPFTWQGHRGVFKLLKPGIEERLEQELAIFADVGEFLDRRCEVDGLPALGYRETLERVRILLQHEIHLEREQEHLGLAQMMYRDTEGVRVPGLIPFCGPRVTAMERLDGRKVTELDGTNAGDRRRLATLLVESLVAMPIWSMDRASLFHADPHAGNLQACDDGSLGILDWSLVGRLDKAARVTLTQLMLGAIAHDASHMLRSLERLCESGFDVCRLQSVIGSALRRIRQGQWPGLTWLVRFLDDAVTRGGLRLGSDLMMFRKALLTLEGVLADVAGDDESFDSLLTASGVRRFGAESWCRVMGSPISREFGTHVSNGDVLSLFWAAPMAVTRYWAGVWEDVARRVNEGRT